MVAIIVDGYSEAKYEILQTNLKKSFPLSEALWTFISKLTHRIGLKKISENLFKKRSVKQNKKITLDILNILKR